LDGVVLSLVCSGEDGDGGVFRAGFFEDGERGAAGCARCEDIVDEEDIGRGGVVWVLEGEGASEFAAALGGGELIEALGWASAFEEV
jgi:hypothetical protein